MGKCSRNAVITLDKGQINSKNIYIRSMQKKDFMTLFEWVKKEEWNPGFYDFESYLLVDRDGFRMLWYDDIPVAALASIKYPHSLGYLGLYVVKPEYRGKSLGRYLWDNTIKRMSDCKTVILNAVINQVSNYEAYGFQKASLVNRWHVDASKVLLERKEISSTYVFTQNISISEIADLDYLASGCYRPQFWKSILASPDSYYLAVRSVGQLVGFGLALKCVRGYKIAPLYCSSFTIADCLLQKICAILKKITVNKDNEIQLDSVNFHKSTSLFEKYGFIKAYNFVMMCRGEEPRINKNILYGINSLEIG